CHCLARSGYRAASEVSGVAIRPLQRRQPLPLARLSIVAGHVCPLAHSHHTFLPLPYVTSSGVSPSFFVGCHSAASWGWVTDRGSLVYFTRLKLAHLHKFGS